MFHFLGPGEPGPFFWPCMLTPPWSQPHAFLFVHLVTHSFTCSCPPRLWGLERAFHHRGPLLPQSLRVLPPGVGGRAWGF